MASSTGIPAAPDGAVRAGASPVAGAPVASLAVALTMCDSMRTLEPVLRAAVALAGRVVAVDSGSRDGSVELAESLKVEVIRRAWAGHVAQKQFAIDACAGAEWVLLLDSDEIVSPDLARAIREALAPGAAAPAGYRVNRRLVFGGRPLRHTFQPEWRLRLFRPSRAKVAGTPPHDRVDVDGAVADLPGDLLHDSWKDVDDMLRRQVGYARIAADADTLAHGGGLLDIAVRPGAAFLKQYVLKQGFRDGWRGLAVAGGVAAATLMKHVAIAERRGLRRDA
ncbi:MAG: glycosyltransferase family 2 protein [Phycisphaerae bacterium]|nr:glycosyltransferase family 2 protein [Phycisphaerae bacterium]